MQPDKIFKSNNNGSTLNNSSVIIDNKTGVNQTGNPTWHVVQTYNKPNDGMKSFDIKGARFKIEFSGTNEIITDPFSADVNANKIQVIVYMDQSVISNEMIKWTKHRDDPTIYKSKIVEFGTGPGPYRLNMIAPQVNDWTLTIYDFY